MRKLLNFLPALALLNWLAITAARAEDGIWLDPSLLWHADIATFSAQVLGDPLDYSDGTQVRISGEHPFTMGNFQLVPRVSAIWYDRNHIDHYYGVHTNEATLGRPAYQESADVDFKIGMRANCDLSQHQLIFLDLDDTQQGSAVRESPLADRTNETGVRLAYLYRF